MSTLAEMGRWTILAGLLIVAAGVLLWLAGQIPGLQKLPGTWVWESERVKVVAPIGAMILLSIILTVILNVVLRLFR